MALKAQTNPLIFCVFLCCSILFVYVYAILTPDYWNISHILTQYTTFNLFTSPSNSPSEASVTLIQFLSQYNKSTLIRFVRNIEYSIYFEKINNTYNTYNNTQYINKHFWSDISPHYYDGPINLSPGKTCKVIRGMYRCTPNAPIQNSDLNEWTLRINENQLDSNTKYFLHTLQTQYNFYTNVYEKFISNLRIYSSPFMIPTNIYSFGNSHLKQLIQSLSCIMDEIEINIFNHSFDTSIISFWPQLRPIRYRIPMQYNYNDTLCGEYYAVHTVIGSFENNGWGQNITNKMLKYHRVDKNIRFCTTKLLHVEYTDMSNLYFHFNHNKIKRIQTMIADSIRHIESNVYINETRRKKHINILENGQLDIIIFNVGNMPWYDFEKHLETDLKLLNHSNKFVILLSEWWTRASITQPLMFNETFLKEFEIKYPNVIWLDLWRRNTLKLIKWKYGVGFGKQRSIVCENVQPRVNHFCLPGVPDHHMIELIELINLLQHIHNLNIE